MLKGFLLSITLAGVALLGLNTTTYPVHAQSQANPGQRTQPGKGDSQRTKAVSGTVASIGSGGHSFTLQLAGGDKSDPHTMNFLVDNNTRVQGQVKVGTQVTVEYQAMSTGDNVAVTVSTQA
jgi:hypothetical protein